MDYLIPMAILTFTALTAILALESRSLVYGAISLAGFFLGLSLFFFYLNLYYLAVFQLLVYVGAVAVLILFAVMVVGETSEQTSRRSFRVFGILGASLVFASFVGVLFYLGTVPSYAGNVPFDIADLAGSLLAKYGLLILVLGLLLAAAAFGAVALAKKEKEEL